MYKSTRSEEKITASRAIINGIASDGGLYIKDIDKKYTKEELGELSKLSYQKLAKNIFTYYFEDLENIDEIISEGYKDKFDIPNIVYTKESGNCYFLELYHGPTLAFKDVALSILPLLMEESKRVNKINEKTIILTATSGDTGSAALCGFQKDANTMMIVLYPTQGVSLIQEKQMLSFASEKQKVIAIDGNFDDAQNLVKKMFNDKNLILYSPKYRLSSANSINIGRLVPQIVYYFYSYFELVNRNKIIIGDKINFVVPTGNFGNILALYMAKQMGLPVSKLICASNINNVLTDFFNKHEYNKNREFYKTSSPSMDILISSNLERLLYYLYQDTNKVKVLMEELYQEGKYDLDNKVFNKLDDFYGVCSDLEETKIAIKEVYDEDKYLIDPHTAVAYMGYKKYKRATNDETLTVIASTASPYKFPITVSEAIMNECRGVDEFSIIKEISEYTQIKYPALIDDLKKNYSKTIWKKEEAYRKLQSLLQELNSGNDE